MTSTNTAITKEFVTQIIELEKPDALLPTMGGQTALNLCIKCSEMGIWEDFDIDIIGVEHRHSLQFFHRFLIF